MIQGSLVAGVVLRWSVGQTTDLSRDERSDTGVLAFALVMMLVMMLESVLLKRRLERPDETAADSHATESEGVIVPTQGLLKAALCMSPDGVVGWAVDIRPPSHCSLALQPRHGFAHCRQVAAVGRLVGVHALLVENDVRFARRSCRKS